MRTFRRAARIFIPELSPIMDSRCSTPVPRAEDSPKSASPTPTSKDFRIPVPEYIKRERELNDLFYAFLFVEITLDINNYLGLCRDFLKILECDFDNCPLMQEEGVSSRTIFSLSRKI